MRNLTLDHYDLVLKDICSCKCAAIGDTSTLVKMYRDENPDLHKQMGCMRGFFQMFNRKNFSFGRCIKGLSHKRNTLGHTSLYNRSNEAKGSSRTPIIVMDKNISKLDSREGSLGTSNCYDDSNLYHDRYRRSPNIVARLMGLGELPDTPSTPKVPDTKYNYLSYSSKSNLSDSAIRKLKYQSTPLKITSTEETTPLLPQDLAKRVGSNEEPELSVKDSHSEQSEKQDHPSKSLVVSLKSMMKTNDTSKDLGSPTVDMKHAKSVAPVNTLAGSLGLPKQQTSNADDGTEISKRNGLSNDQSPKLGRRELNVPALLFTDKQYSRRYRKDNLHKYPSNSVQSLYKPQDSPRPKDVTSSPSPRLQRQKYNAEKKSFSSASILNKVQLDEKSTLTSKVRMKRYVQKDGGQACNKYPSNSVQSLYKPQDSLRPKDVTSSPSPRLQRQKYNVEKKSFSSTSSILNKVQMQPKHQQLVEQSTLTSKVRMKRYVRKDDGQACNKYPSNSVQSLYKPQDSLRPKDVTSSSIPRLQRQKYDVEKKSYSYTSSILNKVQVQPKHRQLDEQSTLTSKVRMKRYVQEDDGQACNKYPSNSVQSLYKPKDSLRPKDVRSSPSPRLQRQNYDAEKKSYSSTSILNKVQMQPKHQQLDEQSTLTSKVRMKRYVQKDDGQACNVINEKNSLSNCENDIWRRSKNGTSLALTSDAEIDGLMQKKLSFLHQYIQTPPNKNCSQTENGTKTMELANISAALHSPVLVLDGSENSPKADDSSQDLRVQCQPMSLPETQLSELNTETNIQNPENADANLFQKLEMLGSTDIEPHTTDFQSPDHEYVFEILAATGLLSRDKKFGLTCSNTSRLHSSCIAINPDMFYALEQSKHDWSSMYESVQEHTTKTKLSPQKLHRRLVFDAVNEILTNRTELVTYSGLPHLLLQTRKQSGEQLFQEIYSEIEKLQATGIKLARSEDDDGNDNCTSTKDVAYQPGWDLDKERAELALGIERLIFRDLINETINEMAFTV